MSQPKSNEAIADEIINDTQAEGFCAQRRALIIRALAQKDAEVAEERINTLREVEVLISRGNDPQWAINHLKTHKLLTPKE